MRYDLSLNGRWQLRRADLPEVYDAAVPGSVYTALLDAGKMDDPYWRDNEIQAFHLMDHDWVFTRAFLVSDEMLRSDAVELVCEGLDTLAEVTVNGQKVLFADNMHRTYTADLKPVLKAGENTVTVCFPSPNREIKRRFAATPAEGSTDCTVGFPLLRKAHCMYGWDWGPRLPDAGIWRDILIRCRDIAGIESVKIRQKHAADSVTLHFEPQLRQITDAPVRTVYEVTAPDGTVFPAEGGTLVIDHPDLWWPNGYGSQPLYKVTAKLLDADGRELDSWSRRIGLRTMQIVQEQKQDRKTFEVAVNGVSIFSMGADYIPEDNILSRMNPERTRILLGDAAAAHFNSIRVWGGGFYPADWFYDICDELGLIVWQDFMFACAVYELDDAFEANIRAEIRQNVIRLRHHASLGLFCGNNENEVGVLEGWYNIPPKQKADYIKMFEYIFPHIVKEEAPDVFYWPASPSSGGNFDNPADPNRGDVHYWQVWHGGVPFTEYRKYRFSYVSEFGFQSFPCLKTVESFTLPEDRNVFSYIMEKHQRNNAANGKILTYLSQMYLYPAKFDDLLYASQLLQADAIRYGVEHWRRNRGDCMGAIYWQLNDCWPVASWSSIDYFGRWKALHYAARRFFAPVLLSCEEEGTLTQRTNVNAEMPEEEVERSIRLNVSNELREAQTVTVEWALRDPSAKILREEKQTLTVPALSAVWLDKVDLPEADLHRNYVSYRLLDAYGAEISSGCVLFCAPKHFAFEDPQLEVSCAGDTVTVKAGAFAQHVEIVCDDGDVLFEDNDFDMNAGERTVRIQRGTGTKFRVRSVYNIR